MNFFKKYLSLKTESRSGRYFYINYRAFPYKDLPEIKDEFYTFKGMIVLYIDNRKKKLVSILHLDLLEYFATLAVALSVFGLIYSTVRLIFFFINK